LHRYERSLGWIIFIHCHIPAMRLMAPAYRIGRHTRFNRSSHVLHLLKLLVERDRVIADAYTRRVTDRFGDCRRDAADTEFGDTLWPSSAIHGIGLVEDEYFLMRNVGIDRRLDAAHLARNAIIPLFPELVTAI
jgi:hypothetical protein